MLIRLLDRSWSLQFYKNLNIRKGFFSGNKYSSFPPSWNSTLATIKWNIDGNLLLLIGKTKDTSSRIVVVICLQRSDEHKKNLNYAYTCR